MNTIGNVQTGIALESWRSNLNTNQVTIGHESLETDIPGDDAVGGVMHGYA